MNTTRQTPVCLLAWACFLWAAVWAAAAEPIVGWRGDGTGKYLSADPPTAWGRISPAVQGLRFQASRPKDSDPGAPMPDGVARQWLILGPVAVPKEDRADKEVLPDEAQLDPEEGQKTGQQTWKKVTLETAWLDFAALLGKSPEVVAYACTRVYSATDRAFRLNLSCVGPVRVYVNGKPAQPSGTRFKVTLTKGWNRLLLRVSPGENDWFAVPVLHAWGPSDYQDTNIAWRRALPGVHPGFYGGGFGVGAPVIVGDRIYVPSEPHDLVCINKADGKVLWLRRSSYLEAATEEDKASPTFKQAEKTAAEIDAINAAFVAGAASDDQLQEKIKLEKELLKRLKRVDPDKYAIETITDIGFSGFTPATDGRFVYTWSASGVSACYDLEGNRRWIRVDRLPAVEHGFTSSPLLVDGKLVVFLRDLLAFDARTGKLAWRVPVVSHEGLNPPRYFHGTPAAVCVGGTWCIALGNNRLLRASDGKVVYDNQKAGNQSVASPVAEGNELFLLTGLSMELFMNRLPETFAEPLQLQTRSLTIDTAAYPKHYLPWHCSSPVIHGELAYLLNNAGVFTVVDVAAGKVVYQKLLDLDPYQASNEGAARGIGASLALAGKYLYALGNNGAALVIEPGRTYKQVAKNKIENVVMVKHWAERQERFVGNPVFDGKRLYLRGEENLYAIGPK